MSARYDYEILMTTGVHPDTRQRALERLRDAALQAETAWADGVEAAWQAVLFIVKNQDRPVGRVEIDTLKKRGPR